MKLRPMIFSATEISLFEDPENIVAESSQCIEAVIKEMVNNPMSEIFYKTLLEAT